MTLHPIPFRPSRWPAILLAVLTLVLVPACDSGTTPDDESTPIPLPAPAGTLPIGTTQYFLPGTDRDDGYTAQVGDARPLMVQVWYPAASGTGTVAAYMEPEIADLFGVTQDYVPAEDFPVLMASVRPNAHEDVAVASTAAGWPLVFLSHGLGGTRALYTTYAEDLASRGFVVVGIDHTYGALGTLFPDGRLVGIRAGAASPPFEQVVRIWAEDMSYVLDRLEEFDQADPNGILTGRLDLTKVGAAGHSTGGSAAMEVATFDARFSAVASLDGVQVGSAAAAPGLGVPLLMMLATNSEYGGTEVQDHLQAPGVRVTIANTTHYSFTDLPVLLDLVGADPTVTAASVRPPGAIDGNRNLQIQTAFLAAFFDRWLNGEPSALLGGAVSAYPEITFEAIGQAN